MRYFFTVLLTLFVFLSKAQTIDLESKYPLKIVNQQQKGNLILMLSGDGGINNTNIKMANSLSKIGATVVILDCRKYFWKQQSPESFSIAVTEIIEHYLKSLDKSKFSILGYSFGADVAAFTASRIPPKLKDKMNRIVLVSPSQSTDFVIRMSDMLFNSNKKRKYDILNEVSKNKDHIMIVIGKNDESIAEFINKKAELILMDGGHNLNNDFDKMTLLLKKHL